MKSYKATVSKLFPQKTNLGEFLIKLTNLKSLDVEQAAHKGAVWIQRSGKGKILRIRKISEIVNPQDVIQLFYDPKVLGLPELLEAECLFENKNYGIWIKPRNIMSQGTQTGDHTSLLRLVEIKKKQEVFLVHRLDRETSGLMLIAYNSKAAAALSDMFQKNLVFKEYEAIVLGEMPVGKKETINASLDDKEAVTHYEVLKSMNNQSLLKVKIDTGRLHQIRRHLDSINHPVMGDPKYGRGNKNREGLMLLAKTLGLKDPWENKEISWNLNHGLSLS